MTATGREIGTLIVVVLKAKNLPNKRHIGKQDPYCSIALNGERRRTKAIKRGGQHPEWDEEIRFALYEEIEDTSTRPVDGTGTPPPLPPKNATGPPDIKGGKFMKLACFADDNREPDLIGETNVDLTEVLTKGETDEWFALSAKDKYAGEVYLELTFWSNEPAPKKTSKSKNRQSNAQYGGTGHFVPFVGSSPSNGAVSYHSSSRVPSTSSTHGEYSRDSSPLRSSNSSAKVDLYMAPYESNPSYHLSTVERVTSDFSELSVPEVRQRRDTYPPRHDTRPPPRPPSAQLVQSQTFGDFSHSSYLDPGPNSYDLPMASNPYQPQSSFPPPAQGYQIPQDTGSSISYHPPPRGPRYSLPNPPSKFMSLSTPAPSGFTPPRQPPESTGFRSRAGPTHIPTSYGLHPSSSHPSVFTSHTPAPSGFVPTRSSLPFQSSYQNQPYHLPSVTPAPYVPASSAPPPSSLPPQQYPPPLPPSSVPPHSQSAPPRQGSYPPATPSPPHDQVLPLPPNQIGTPPSAHGSRPLPQPQTSIGGHTRRQSALPIPPSGGFSPTHSPSRPETVYQGGSYGTPAPYNSIPPPPPLPSHSMDGTRNPVNHQPGLFVPPPPPLSQSHSESPSRRFNLPQPPSMPLHPQQLIYQHIPPPPNNMNSQPYFPGPAPPPFQYPPTNPAEGSYYPPEGSAWN